MKWPGIIRFDNSDDLEMIESQSDWDTFLETVDAACQLILSDGTIYNISTNTASTASIIPTEEIASVDTTVELARKHMAAQAHCCVAKFNAPSVEAVIAALVQLDA